MKRVAWIVAVVIVVSYFVNSYMDNKARLEVERAKAE
jgi:hypothetical protein